MAIMIVSKLRRFKDQGARLLPSIKSMDESRCRVPSMKRSEWWSSKDDRPKVKGGEA